ncbi:hypothetical protein T12_13196 [Trichinella patagoniensis]|uniref:Uncharacterized protein n=1 Tax=Trichinella patagoniensis TaxID=990121 RepID=A0A0V0ZSR9_9BILA|nr:hypothetical protein T12_13196 [Trichinella patagoniensis]
MVLLLPYRETRPRFRPKDPGGMKKKKEKFPPFLPLFFQRPSAKNDWKEQGEPRAVRLAGLISPLTTTAPDRLSAHSKQDALHQYDGQAQHVEEPPSKSKIILHGCRLENDVYVRYEYMNVKVKNIVQLEKMDHITTDLKVEPLHMLNWISYRSKQHRRQSTSRRPPASCATSPALRNRTAEQSEARRRQALRNARRGNPSS